MSLRNFWEWLGDEKNLKRVGFLWPAALAVSGGLIGASYWAYSEFSKNRENQNLTINSSGDKIHGEEVQLRTALMLREYGNLRRDVNDFIAAEKSYYAALELIRKDDEGHRYHYGLILLDQIRLYKMNGDSKNFESKSEEYRLVFISNN